MNTCSFRSYRSAVFDSVTPVFRSPVSLVFPDPMRAHASVFRNDLYVYVLGTGPTNSGKTYNAIERLKQVGANRKPGDGPAGIFCGPLRLLALEVYEQASNIL